MAWTNRQKAVAATSAREAGLDDDYRKLVLRQLPNALYDAKGNRVDEPTSTSKRLTHSDFEFYMSVIERAAGGKLKQYARLHWQKQADDVLKRMRYRVSKLAEALEAAGQLAPNGEGLAGWIRARVTKGEHDQLDRLDYHGLHVLIVGLSSFARQRHVDVA